MTPATLCLTKARVVHRVHEYRRDPGAAGYGVDAAAALGVDPRRVFKTLIAAATGDDALHVAVVPVSRRLDLKLLARIAGVKRLLMARREVAERATGYVVGGISPLGQRKSLPTWLDISAAEHATIFISAGRRGLEIELCPTDLRYLTRAELAAIAR